jgi:chromosome segregation protein
MVSRDGQSSYYLNGAKCRRRDITDLFLGTGLGPRSYAIIEQGMISQVIDAKPEELRVYLEEAAGISKYKERRKRNRNPHPPHPREPGPPQRCARGAGSATAAFAAAGPGR